MRIGRMNNRITIQQEVVAKDDYGQEIKTWQDWKTVFADIKNYNGNESYMANQEVVISRTEMYIRYIPAISVKMRIKYDETWKGTLIETKFFKIESLNNINNENTEIKILCTKIEQ